jgi:hypothetical protein
MAGLVAAISHRPSVPVPEGEVARLLDTFADVRGGAIHRRMSVPHWAHVGLLDIGAQATVERTGASWLAAVGAIHADSLLAATPVEALDGQFAGVRYDADAGTVEVFTDPFGMQALYCATSGGHTYISTSAVALARHLDAQPDELGMGVFLRAGYQIGPATHWRGIERIEPGIALTFRDGPPTRRVYWMPEVDEHVRSMTLDKTADHCADVLIDRIRRRLAGSPLSWADLTGGFDSRMVAGAAMRAGVSFVANTSGDESDADVRLARDVAAACGFAWRHVPLPADWAIDGPSARRAAAWADGALDVFQLARVMRQHELKAEMSRRVITGGGGEHFNAFPWQHEFLRAGRSRTVNYEALLNMRYLKDVDSAMLVRAPDAEVREYFHERLRERARRYAGEPNTTQLDAIYAYKSVGHFGAFRSAGEGVVRSEIPCYYRDIFVAAFSAHHRWRTNHRLQRRVMARLSPALAAVRTTRGGSAEPIAARNAHHLIPYYASVAQRAARKLSRLGRPALPASPRDAIVQRNRRGLEALRRDGVFDLPNMRSAALYEPAKFDDFVARTATADTVDWPMVGRIVTVELALQAASRQS